MKEYSAGGVVYRKLQVTSNKPQVVWLICKHSGYHKWVLPKGIVEEGENPEEAALREVGEETGVKAKIIKKITPDVTYKYTKNGMLVDKRVEFFLMEYADGDVANHNWEMEGAKWVSVEEGLVLLGFETEKQALREAIRILKRI